MILGVIILVGLSSPPVVKDEFFIQASEPAVLISEVCWMGSEDSSSDEWIELHNPSSDDIDISGWKIESSDGRPDISLEGLISDQGYFLLERTDDDSAPGALADMIYSGSLSNDGEILRLYDDDDNLIDMIDASEGWPAGDNSSKQTMVFIKGFWKTGEKAGGSPGGKNKASEANSQEAEQKSKVEDKELKEKKEGRIIISEIYPNPPGSDREREFIELMNIGRASVNLEGWRIKAGERVYEFGELDILYKDQFGKIIAPGKHFVIFRSQSNLVLNNSGLKISIFKPESEKEEDFVEYGKAPQGYSYVKTAYIDLESISTATKEFFLNSSSVGGWVWSSQISPGGNNQVKPLNTPPKAFFSAPDRIEPKKETFFDASDTIDEQGDDMEFSWDFGDGVEIKMEEARHTFLEPGEYRVVLEVSDGLESSFFSKKVLVGEKKAPDLIPKRQAPENWSDDWFEEAVKEPVYDFPAVVKAKEKRIPIKETVSFMGKMVEVEGSVATVDGVIGTQYFYIIDDEAGIRVYNHKKDFPELKIGDIVRAKGEVTEIRGETTLKTADGSDIEVLGPGPNPRPVSMDAEDIVEDNIGRLVNVEGRIDKKNLPRLYIADKKGEIRVYLKPGSDISAKDIEEDDEVRITGILGVVSGDIVLMPRKAKDIVFESKYEEANTGQVLSGQKIPEWELSAEEENKGLFKYFLAVLAAFLILLFVYFYQKKKAAS